MRLTKHDEVRATNEWLGTLASVHPEWVRTSQLRGTRRFHGGRTLSHSQIIRLVRASGQVEERVGGNERFSFLEWRTKSRATTTKSR
jgi:hypothetical protein